MEKKQNQTAEEMRAIFAGMGRTAIVGHVRPDGDCVCSCLSLQHYLKEVYQCEADVYLDSFSEAFSILPGIGAVNSAQGQDSCYDTVISLDCADEERIGAGKALFQNAQKKIVIDHHISNPFYGEINYVMPTIGSCCEVLYTIFEEQKITYEMAVCLFTGMAHDTGVFQYSNVTPQTLQRETKLISFGFDFTEIIQKTFYQKKLSATKASGFALSRAQLFLDGLGVWSFITQEELQHFGTDASGVESVVSRLRDIEGVDLAVFLYETQPGVFKCSMRSSHTVNVSELAMQFGGGGHIRAAGCSFSGMMPEDIIREIAYRIS